MIAVSYSKNWILCPSCEIRHTSAIPPSLSQPITMIPMRPPTTTNVWNVSVHNTARSPPYRNTVCFISKDLVLFNCCWIRLLYVFLWLFCVLHKSILIIQYINDNNNRCYLRIIYCTAKWSFLYEKRRIRWTVEAYQWGIEGHHYPHTDNGPPQGQSGHWRKQNKRRNQNYYSNFLTQNSKLSIWNVWAKMMTITTAMSVPRHTF